MSGTDETSSEANLQGAGCPCGRVHTSNRPPRAFKPRAAEDRLGTKLYAALVAGKAVQDPATGFWWVAYQGDCLYPGIMNAHDIHGTRAKRLVRCRQCSTCRRAKRNYWAYAALEQTRIAQESGQRTWFGTLTLSPAAQGIMLDRARLASDEPNASYWDDPKCDRRFSGVRKELQLEVRRYWARLRKTGHRFKYLLVFERHKTGLPHMHFLLHEVSGPVRKRELEAQWLWGFSKPILVGGSSKRTIPPTQAAFYVAKYLSKSNQARQIASKGYRPSQRTSCHSEARPNV